MKFIQEFRRRSVFSVGAVYVVVAWLLLQVADIVLPIYNAPAWILPAFSTLLFLGFPIALVLAWAYDLTPMGVKRPTGAPTTMPNRRGTRLSPCPLARPSPSCRSGI